MSKDYGIDSVDWQPDYTKSKEENREAYREAYRKVHGEYPPAPLSEEEFEKQLEKANKK